MCVGEGTLFLIEFNAKSYMRNRELTSSISQVTGYKLRELEALERGVTFY